MVRTDTRKLEEVDGAEAPTAVAAVIAVTIAETSQLQNILSKEKNKRRSDFWTDNYWNRAQTLSIQEDLWCSSRILCW